MNDRFKFRAWDKKNKQMIELVGFAIPDLCKDGSGQLDFAGLQGGFGGHIRGKLKDFIIMQCTGLRDINGNLIYEGDIWENLGLISYDDNSLRWRVGGFALMQGIKDIKIIGNKFENPELLEE